MQRTVEEEEKEQEVYSSEKLWRYFLVTKYHLLFFNQRKLQGNTKKVEPTTLKNYECQKITNSTLMSECWLPLTAQDFNFAFQREKRGEKQRRHH